MKASKFLYFFICALARYVKTDKLGGTDCFYSRTENRKTEDERRRICGESQ
jgi:hypothetical protein